MCRHRTPTGSDARPRRTTIAARNSDTNLLADHEARDDAQGDRVAERRSKVRLESDPSVCEREERDNEE